MAKDLGKLISERRLALGKTLDEIGRAVGVSKSTVQRWESGNIRNMRRDKLVSLAQALATTPDYLMGWVDTPDSKELNAEGKAHVRQTTKEGVFEFLLFLSGYRESLDDDAYVTIYKDNTTVNKTPELVDRIMEDVIDYFTYQIEREAKR